MQTLMFKVDLINASELVSQREVFPNLSVPLEFDGTPLISTDRVDIAVVFPLHTLR